jgi:ABC-type sugar transport system permease subunit
VLQYYGYKKSFPEGMIGYGSAIAVLLFLVTFALVLLYIRWAGAGMIEEKTR